MRGFIALAVLAFGAGCYVYQPVGDGVPDPGVEVRAHLSPTQEFDIGEITVQGVARIEGVVYRATPDTVAVWGQWLYSQFGRYDPRGAVFYVDRHKVPMLEARKLQPARSVVAVAIGLGIGYGLFNFIADPGGTTSEGPNEGPVEAHLVPSVR